MNINNIVSQAGNIPLKSDGGNKPIDSSNSFKELLAKFTQTANEADSADKLSNLNLMIGETESTHQAMIAAEKADISLKLTLQIRNKILDAYNEIMRMQI